VAEHGLHDLDDAWIVATAETPVPYSPTLEDAYIPDAEAIASAVRARLGVRGVASRRPSRFFQRARLACGLRFRDRRP
jgi:hypothetical protein